MRYLLASMLFFILFSCSENGTDSKEEEENSTVTDSSQAIDDFYGDWYLAAEIEGEWWHIDGCDNYSLHVTPPTNDDTHLGQIAMGDRIGLSVDLYARLLDFTIDEKGLFIFNCTDEYSENADFTFSGLFHETFDPWGEEVIELDLGYLWDQLRWGIDGDVKKIILFKGEGARNFPEHISEIECSGDVYYEDVLEDYIPVEGLNDENISNDLISNVIRLNGGTVGGPEDERFEYMHIFEYFILVRDYEYGGYTDLSFYSVNSYGELIDKTEYSGVFEYIIEDSKYLINNENVISCLPGRWEPEEGTEQVNLITRKVKFSINDYGEFIDKQSK